MQFCSEFPPGSRDVIETSILPLRDFFLVLRKYAIAVYVDKYLNIAILFRISPRFQKWYRKFNPTRLNLATRFFSKWFGWFLKNISRQSVHRNFQSFSQPSPGSGLVYQCIVSHIGKYIVHICVVLCLNNLSLYFPIRKVFLSFARRT